MASKTTEADFVSAEEIHDVVTVSTTAINTVVITAKDSTSDIGIFLTGTSIAAEPLRATGASGTQTNSLPVSSIAVRASTSTSTSAHGTVTATAHPNLNISNGTCYSGPNEPMDSGFIPCGNSAAQIQTCCWKGDFCLSDHACFGIHDNGYDTYLAGCTDSQWNTSDPGFRNACPIKPAPYGEEPWVGLTFCGNSSSQDKNAWIACPQASSPSTMVSPGPCVCPTVMQQQIVAFLDGPTLSSYASLPSTSGGSIMWIPPFSPTYPVSATAAPPAESSSPPTAGMTAPLHGTAPAVPSSTRSMSLVIGVAVGIGGFVVLAVVGVIAFLWMAKRRRRRGLAQLARHGDGNVAGDAGSNSHNQNEEITDQKQDASSSPIAPSVAVSELEIRPARPWSLRSELDGSSAVARPATASGNPSGEDTAARGSIGTLLASPPISPPLTPGLGDMYESPTVSSLQGQLTRQTTGQTTTAGGRSSRLGASNFETLVELEG